MTTLTDNERLRAPGVEYIRKNLSDRVKILQRSVLWYRRRHYITTLSGVLLSAAITVTAGLEGTWVNGQITKNLVLVMGAISTVMSAWGAFFSPREIWHLYVSTIGKLRGVESRLGLAVALGDGGQISAEEIKAFFNEYECIMKEHNSRWLEIRGNSDV